MMESAFHQAGESGWRLSAWAEDGAASGAGVGLLEPVGSDFDDDDEYDESEFFDEDDDLDEEEDVDFMDDEPEEDSDFDEDAEEDDDL